MTKTPPAPELKKAAGVEKGGTAAQEKIGTVTPRSSGGGAGDGRPERDHDLDRPG